MKKRIATITVFILSLLLILNIVLFTNDIRTYGELPVLDDSVYTMYLETNNYPVLSEEAKDIDLNQASAYAREIYALAQYYDAAILHQAYLTADDTEKITYYQEQMIQAQEELEELLPYINKINAQIDSN